MNDISSRATKLIMQEIREPLARLGIDEAEVQADFNLVGSGVVDSMRFLDLLGALEQEFGYEIKLDQFEIEEVTTLSGLIRAVAASVPHAHG